MNTVKTTLFAVAGLSIAVLATLFTASLFLAVAGIATVLLAARAVSYRMQPKPVPVYARSNRAGGREPVRVWNDGKGTIIDM